MKKLLLSAIVLLAIATPSIDAACRQRVRVFSHSRTTVRERVVTRSNCATVSKSAVAPVKK